MASVDQPATSTVSTTTTAPAVTITPASPTNTLPSTVPTPLQPSTATVPEHEMKEKSPTDSETALLANKNTAGPSTETKPTTARSESPLSTLTRKLSGKGTSKSDPTNKAEKSTTSPTPIASTSRSAPSALSSKATATGTSTGSNVAGKKKKKRKGLAGFFAALGCLSVYEMEDEPAKSSSGTGTRDMAQKPGSTVTKPVTSAAVVTGDKASTPVVKPSTDTGAVGASATQGEAETAPAANKLDDVSKGATDATGAQVQAQEAVVLAPTEPVLPIDETAGVTSGAVQPPGSGSELLSTPNRPGVLRRESDTTPTRQQQSLADQSTTDDAASPSGVYADPIDADTRLGTDNVDVAQEEQDYVMEEEYEDEEDRLIAQGGMGIPLDENGHPAPLLPVMDKIHQGRKCLVLDLDETLLHSSFKMLPSADYIVPVEIESQVHNVYVIKRPGVDHFLTEMGKIYEVVVFTASLSKYADPVLDMLDPAGVVRHRLFRESCYNHKGNYVKDLSQLGRDMEGCIIIDNSPASYIFHPNNAVPVSTWFNDPHDTELTDLCPFLTDLATVDDIRGVLDGSI